MIHEAFRFTFTLARGVGSLPVRPIGSCGSLMSLKQNKQSTERVSGVAAGLLGVLQIITGSCSQIAQMKEGNVAGGVEGFRCFWE